MVACNRSLRWYHRNSMGVHFQSCVESALSAFFVTLCSLVRQEQKCQYSGLETLIDAMAPSANHQIAPNLLHTYCQLQSSSNILYSLKPFFAYYKSSYHRQCATSPKVLILLRHDLHAHEAQQVFARYE